MYCLLILHLWWHLFHIVLSLPLSVCQRLASTHLKCYFYLNTQRELGRKPISVCKGCFIVAANFRWKFLIIFIKTVSKDDCQLDKNVLAPRINDCPPTLIIVSFSEKKRKLFICQCRVEAHIKITCAKSQGQCEPYVFHVPSSTRSASCQVQWPWSRVKIIVTGHIVFWMDFHLWMGHEGHGRDTSDVIW